MSMNIELPEQLMTQFFKKRLITKPKTKEVYSSMIRKYFDTIQEQDIQKYVKKPALEIEKDLTNAYLKLNNSPKYTLQNIFYTTKTFLSVFNKEVKDLDFWDTFKGKMRQACMASEELVPDPDELRKFLEYANVKEKAMFLTMASCGCRIGELVSIDLEYTYLDEEPARIRLTKTKNGKPRTTFITPEATRAVKDWLKTRDKYLKQAVKRNTPNKKGVKTLCTKTLDDTRLFPLDEETVRKIWHKLCKRSGMYKMDKKTGRLTFHPHTLRKYFRSYFGNADLAELLMGHEGYLSTYRKLNDKQKGKEYLKHMNNIVIFDRIPQLDKVNQEIQQLKSENEKLENRLNEFTELMRELLQKDDKN